MGIVVTEAFERYWRDQLTRGDKPFLSPTRPAPRLRQLLDQQAVQALRPGTVLVARCDGVGAARNPPWWLVFRGVVAGQGGEPCVEFEPVPGPGGEPAVGFTLNFIQDGTVGYPRLYLCDYGVVPYPDGLWQAWLWLEWPGMPDDDAADACVEVIAL